ncbi:MBL fold metallo-hydrolase [Halapricum salinum]|uniref:MBL fold metallo-hydrolase n=1 Tax=Halapricum salinum TaxID=1457250 RepID=A0A4D6HCV1_9EURY|nr:MBL fold metallo-hydrolase [Halapricum salinum]
MRPVPQPVSLYTARTTVTAIAVAFLIVLAGCSTGVGPDTTPAPTTDDDLSQTTTGTTDANGTLEVHFINVGQSVSTLVVGPTGETMLIDSGHYRDDGEYVLQYLQRHNIDRIDYLITSHNDADHIGGNAAIIEYFETEADGIGAVYDPGIAASTQTYAEYLDAIEEHDVTLYETREGDSIPLDGVDVAVLGPPEPYLENEARNENSIVLKLTHGETSFLLTGDAEDDQEAYLVDTYGSQLQATVLKAGHHGSSSSSSESFLDTVQPQAIIVSSAYDSQYGHPTEEVLERFADRSLPTFWTATHGDIVLVSDGQGVSVRTQQDAPTDPQALRDGAPVEPGTSGDLVERLRLGGEPVTDPTATTVTDGGTTSGELSVATIHADADGDDRENLNDEYIVFENTGDESIDLSGWTVTDDAGHTYTFPAFTLDPSATVTLRTGSGTDTATDLYWGASSPIWNNAGDTVIVTNSTGEQVLSETYP